MKLYLETLKSLFPTKQVLYAVLERGTYNFVLPARKSSGVTIKYLMKAASRSIFTIDKSKYQKAPQVLLKSFIIDELLIILKNITKQELGFEECKYPNKEWVLNCIYSIDKNHDIFSIRSLEFYRTIPKE